MVSTLNKKINSSYIDLENELKKNISGEKVYKKVEEELTRLVLNYKKQKYLKE